MQVVIILFSAVKSMQKCLADDTFCACIGTAVDFSIQIQMNQWKIVRLPVWIKCDILSGVVMYLVRVQDPYTWQGTNMPILGHILFHDSLCRPI